MAEAPEASALTPAAPAAAPEVQVTAPVTEAPVSGEQKPVATPEQQPEKTFSQADLDRIVAQRLARQQRQFEREQQLRQQPVEAKPESQQPASKPIPSQYATTEEYIEAVSDWKAKQVVEETFRERESRVRHEREQQHAASVEAQYEQQEEAVRVAIPNYDEVVYGRESLWNTSHPAVLALAQTVKHSDKGALIAHKLAADKAEFTRLANLHPRAQAIEVGKLAARLGDAPPAPTQTSAPAPIPGVKPNSTLPAYDTTDPRSTTMGASKWIEAERKRQLSKLAGANR